MSRGLISTIVCVGLLALVGAVLLPALARPSNCGGNSYALTACKQILIYDQWAKGTNGAMFDLARLEADDQTNLFRVVTSHWSPGAGYWLRTNRLEDKAVKQVVVVCDVCYSNVPQPTIWNFYRQNPAHAVGYLDGTVGLISPAEFKELDRQSFISLTDMATNSTR